MIQKLLDFIASSPTSFHAVDAAQKMLCGFEHVYEHEPWDLHLGGKYVVTRNDASLIAFTIPGSVPKGYQMVASHADSPMFKVKEHAEVEVRGKYTSLNTEGYGGMIMASWMDRPLSLAGRVLVRRDNRLETHLVDLHQDIAVIPHVAIHMNREVNEGFKYQAHVDMMPLFGSADAKGSLMEKIASQADCEPAMILGHDLFLYNRMPGTIWGADQAYFSSPRIDNLECAYASLQALLQAKTTDRVQVLCIFDNEEVGSMTRQGAHSMFLSDVLRRISLSLGLDEATYFQMLGQSFMLSADNAHAVHPNHPELSDAQNAVYMNEGIVIKHSANQKYTTDALSEGFFRYICDTAGIPTQHFHNRSDMRGGSTLGNLSASHVSVPTVDIGLAQLSMHSSFETAGAHDLEHMIHGMRAFYETVWELDAGNHLAFT